MNYDLGGGVRGQRTLAEAGSDLAGDYGLDFVGGMLMQLALLVVRPMRPKAGPTAPVVPPPVQPKRAAPRATEFELEMNFEDYRGS